MHPDYKKDSCLSDSINYDIVCIHVVHFQSLLLLTLFWIQLGTNLPSAVSWGCRSSSAARRLLAACPNWYLKTLAVFFSKTYSFSDPHPIRRRRDCVSSERRETTRHWAACASWRIVSARLWGCRGTFDNGQLHEAIARTAIGTKAIRSFIGRTIG